MSRVGKLPIAIPEAVTVNIDGMNVTVSGPKGKLEKVLSGSIIIKHQDKVVEVTPSDNSKQARAMWGTARSLIANMVKGAEVGFEEDLELHGVGYRAAVQGDYLSLSLAKSHNTRIEIPEGITVAVEKQTLIKLAAHDKEKLGQFIAVIVRQRPPEPYKGKGIRKKGQYVQRKEGKKS